MPTLNSLRAALVALTACSLLVPAAAMAGPVPSTGTVIGTVTCGAAEVDHAAHVLVSLEDIGMSTHTDGSGKFILSNVPANRGFTLDAVGSPTAFVVASRYNIVVQPGQTVDVGNLDLSVCPRAADPDEAATMDQVSDARD